MLPVGDVQQHRGILTVLARAVDLQLHAEEAGPGAVENGAGLEIVIVDGTVFNVGAAVAAIRIVVIVGVPAVIKGDEAAAAGTPSVIAVAAVGANRVSVVVGQAFTIPEAGCRSRHRSLSYYPGSPGTADCHGTRSGCRRYSRSVSRCEWVWSWRNSSKI